MTFGLETVEPLGLKADGFEPDLDLNDAPQGEDLLVRGGRQRLRKYFEKTRREHRDELRLDGTDASKEQGSQAVARAVEHQVGTVDGEPNAHKT